jgi:hypothetical protein
MTLLDEIRQAPDETTRTTHAGFDPDLHDAALAVVDVEVDKHQQRRLIRAACWKFRANRNLREYAATGVVVREMTRRIELFAADSATVEGQQVYNGPGQGSAEKIAKANDLLHIGAVSGAALALFDVNGVDAVIVKPAAWKGQRKKLPMWERAMQILKLDDRTVLEAFDERAAKIDDYLDDIGPHCADALCMALMDGGFHV